MKKYTVGFLFSSDLSQVLLIHKLTPEWQKGKLNGLGGKLEKGESTKQSFIREIYEESGITLESKQVIKMGLLKGVEWKVFVFAAVYEGEIFTPKTYEKELLEWFEVDNLPANCVPNLYWQIPFARNELRFKTGNSYIMNEPKFDTTLL